MKKIKLHIEDNGIAFLSIINKPVNALSIDLLNDIYKTVNLIASNNEVKVLIIKSGLSNFCAGADLKERSMMNDKEVISVIDKINDCFDLIESLDIVTIASINGVALGGGAELALCCDFRIGSESSKVGFPETSIGIIPGAGGTYRLSDLIGLSKAKYWILSSRKFEAEESLDDGFFDFLAKDDELLEASIDLAEEIISNSKDALKIAKRAIMAQVGSDQHKRVNELTYYKKTLKLKDRLDNLKKIRE